jgi:hypothetical protein
MLLKCWPKRLSILALALHIILHCQTATICALCRSSAVNSDRYLPARIGPGIFGVPLAESIRYANVAISLTNEHGKSFIYGYVPIVVAKCGVFLKEKGRLRNVTCVNAIAENVQQLTSREFFVSAVPQNGSKIFRQFSIRPKGLEKDSTGPDILSTMQQTFSDDISINFRSRLSHWISMNASEIPFDHTRRKR